MKSSAALIEKMHGWNPWWEGRSFALPEFHRELFSEMRDALKDGKVHILAGPRQTGKTTLLRQLLVDLHASGVAPKDTLYLPLDDFADEFETKRLKLSDLVKVFSEEISKTPLDQKEKFVFLDEVHTCPTWNREIKILYDQKLPLHFVVSGSASAIVLKEAATALAGRSKEYVVLPLSFSEICRTKHKTLTESRMQESQNGLGKALLDLLEGSLRSNQDRQDRLDDFIKEFAGLAPRLRAELARYLRRGGFPEPALKDLSDEATDKYLQTILDQMIRRDFVEFFHVRDTKTLERTIRIIAQNTAKILSERGLSSDLGVAINTVRNHIGFLEKAYVVFAARILSGSVASQSRVSEKLFFLDTGLRNALVGYQHQDIGGLLETAVFVHLWWFFRKHRPSVEMLYWRNKKKFEVDIVLRNGTNLIGIEVHNSDDDVKGLLNFLDEKPKAMGILVSDVDPQSVAKDRIMVIPPHVLLLAS